MYFKVHQIFFMHLSFVIMHEKVLLDLIKKLFHARFSILDNSKMGTDVWVKWTITASWHPNSKPTTHHNSKFLKLVKNLEQYFSLWKNVHKKVSNCNRYDIHIIWIALMHENLWYLFYKNAYGYLYDVILYFVYCDPMIVYL